MQRLIQSSLQLEIRPPPNHFADIMWATARGVAFSLLVGFVSSFLGIGGGVLHVPLLIGALGFPVHVATATSHFVLAKAESKR